MSAIEINNLRVMKSGVTICAVDALEIQAGERVGILGANGCGKTTLLRVLAGLERDFTGECRVKFPLRQRVYQHQSPWMFRGSVLSNVRYGLHAHGLHGHAAEARARQWLQACRIDHMAAARAATLSGGERKRTALARSLAVEPQLVLLDEPLAELDAAGVATVLEVLSGLENITLLIASPAELPEGCVDRQVEIVTPAERAGNPA